jgi:hypothetical protein
MSNTNKQLTVFLDSIGRTIIGKIHNETESTLSVENPALVHIQANPQTNQLQLQILPLFFREFQDNRTAPTVWNYKKATITTSEQIVFANQFVQQYEQIFQSVAQPETPASEPEVVKLFDDEK